MTHKIDYQVVNKDATLLSELRDCNVVSDFSGILGSIYFTTDHSSHLNHVPTLSVPMPILAPEAHNYWGEMWITSSGLIDVGQLGSDIHYSTDGSHFFGVILIEEKENDVYPLQSATERAYDQIFSLLSEFDYPYLWRTWNYIPNIHGYENGSERYWRFNAGRRLAYEGAPNGIDSIAPAACALGHRGGKLLITFLAAKTPALPIANPRQVEAYHYPQIYGPKSPLFSRAVLVNNIDQKLLLISGTASVVGHKSEHWDDVFLQIKETMCNISALLTEARLHLEEGEKIDLAELAYRVYVRYPNHVDIIRKEMQRYLGERLDDILFVQADICRQELLLEIEAVGRIVHV